jgi:hypothetical protein
MARRVYLASVTPTQVSPAYGVYGDTASALRRAMLPAVSAIDVMTTASLSATVGTFLSRQFVSGPLVGGENLAGSTVKGYARYLSPSAASVISSLRVVSLDGSTYKATLVPPATNSIDSLSFRNTPFYFAPFTFTIITSYVLEPFDRFVFEIAHKSLFDILTQVDGRYGASAASDLPEDEVSTLDLNPWLEFSTDFAFLSDSIGATIRGTNVPTVTIGGRNGP